MCLRIALACIYVRYSIRERERERERDLKGILKLKYIYILRF